VISYEQSLHEKNSEAIMQLEPREDNRDGFSMRVAKEKLSKRKEKNKFLLVFSDGEPSAYDYNENGIIDTFEAVNEMNKWGIDVLGFYLSNGPITETEERYMKNIYGNHHLLIPKIEELPFIFSNILKKLILKSL
jgi:nitric oxide reductase activation protein